MWHASLELVYMLRAAHGASLCYLHVAGLLRHIASAVGRIIGIIILSKYYLEMVLPNQLECYL